MRFYIRAETNHKNVKEKGEVPEAHYFNRRNTINTILGEEIPDFLLELSNADLKDFYQ